MTRWHVALMVAVFGCHGQIDPLYGTRPVPAAARHAAPPARSQVMATPLELLAPQEAPPPPAPEPPPQEPPKETPQEPPPTEPPDDAEPVESDDESQSEEPDPTDAQRELDEAAFEDGYLRQKERLVPDQLGKWVAIVGGRLLPADARGRLAPAASFQECLKAADAADPEALHRFLFRIGEEGDVVYADASAKPRSVVGTSFKSAFGIVAAFDARTGELKWTRGEKSRTFKLDHDRIELSLCDPAGRQSMGVRLSDSSSFGGFLLLESTNADLLDAERFEIPGRALLKTGGDPPVVALRRARVRVAVRELDLDEVVPVVAWAE